MTRGDLAGLAAGVRAGRRGDIARAITVVEGNRPEQRRAARQLLDLLDHPGPDAVRVGVTGVPGAGKSTTVNALGLRLISAGHRVGVLAVDPSSRRTGGSILGDRTRMGDLAASDDAFIRPSPSGRALGGVARATRESMLILEAAGFDVIIVETVGVGQNEIAVADMVDTFVLLTLARSGDQLQGIKRGILELADLIVVNKADGDGEMAARAAARELGSAIRLMAPGPDHRRPAVITASALTGAGLDRLWDEVLAHRAWLADQGSLDARRARQQEQWMWALVDSHLSEGVRASPNVQAERAGIEAAVRDGSLSAAEGAERIVTLYHPGG